jgi:uncharacterized membrane protein YoaK (UPF0700 family)
MRARHLRELLLVGLSLASGSVDALGYLLLGRVFVSNMTGNIVLLGLALGRIQVQASIRSLTALVGFCAGVAIGALACGRGGEGRPWPRRVTLTLAVEVAVLLVLAATWPLVVPSSLLLVIGLAAVAMGMQSAAVRKVGVADVATTFVTGTLTGVVTHVAGLLTHRGGHAGEAAIRPATSPWLRVAVLAAYGLGAVAAGAVGTVWQSRAAFIPVAVVSLVAGAGLWAGGFRLAGGER